jgi:hypothetical protein
MNWRRSPKALNVSARSAVLRPKTADLASTLDAGADKDIFVLPSLSEALSGGR